MQRPADGIELRVLDGRRFALRSEAGAWHLDAVYAANPLPARAPVKVPSQQAPRFLHAAWVLLWRLSHLRVSVRLPAPPAAHA